MWEMLLLLFDFCNSYIRHIFLKKIEVNFTKNMLHKCCLWIGNSFLDLTSWMSQLCCFCQFPHLCILLPVSYITLVVLIVAYFYTDVIYTGVFCIDVYRDCILVSVLIWAYFTVSTNSCNSLINMYCYLCLKIELPSNSVDSSTPVGELFVQHVLYTFSF